MDPIESWMDAEAVRRLAGRLLVPVDKPEVSAPEDAGFEPGFVGYVAVPPAVVAPPVVPPPSVPEQQVAMQVPAPVPAAVPEAADVWEDRTPIPEPAPVETPIPWKAAEEVVEVPRPFLSDPPMEAAPAAEPPVAAVAPPQPVEPPPPPPPVVAVVPPPAEPPVESVQPAPLEGKLMARLEYFREWLAARFGAKGAFILDRDGDPVLDDPAFGKLHFLARSLAQAYRPVKGEPGNVHVKIGSASYLAVIPVETAFGCLVLGAVLPEPLEAPAVSTVARALELASQPAKR
jgi:hypothetical protein